MTLHFAILIVYSVVLMAFGLWVGRRVRTAADFFVAGRSLGPGLIFSTMLAANIGAGSTVGAAARGYSVGVAAWWWVGSAAIGSTVLALWIGPAMRRVAEAQQLRTVGDFLEYRYNRALRGTLAVLLWVGAVFILASQLVGLGWILNVVTGVPKPIGSAIGGLVITVYFSAGGLLTSAWVNVIQLAVKMIGFAIALPLAVSLFGGWEALGTVRTADPSYWRFWRLDVTPQYLALLAPAFIVSPGLLQKIFGARDDRAVRIGVGLNALGLFLFAGVPVTLGIIAQGRYPDLGTATNLALPMILMHALPPVVGSIALAAVFSAEVSAADASMFMLTTSLSQDLYKRFIRPDASDERVLTVARWTTLISGLLGVALAWTTEDVIDTLTIFYALISVGLFVPIVGGLCVPRTTTTGAFMSIGIGLAIAIGVQVATGGTGWHGFSPPFLGIVAAVIVWAVSLLPRPPKPPKTGR